MKREDGGTAKDPDDCPITGSLPQHSMDLESPVRRPNSESPCTIRNTDEMGWGREYTNRKHRNLLQTEVGAAKDPDDVMPSGGIGRKRKHAEMEYKCYKCARE